MHHDFWHERWRTGQTGFHQQSVHPFLERWWPRLGVPPDARVYVPLCGKSLDMAWLAKRGHAIVGSELSRVAIEEFFAEPVARADADPAPTGLHAARRRGLRNLTKATHSPSRPRSPARCRRSTTAPRSSRCRPRCATPTRRHWRTLLPRGAHGLLVVVRIPAGNEGRAAVLGRDRRDPASSCCRRGSRCRSSSASTSSRKSPKVRGVRDPGAARDCDTRCADAQ